jgi:hypothetical protein
MKKSFLFKKDYFRSCLPLILALAAVLSHSTITQALSFKFPDTPEITTQKIVADYIHNGVNKVNFLKQDRPIKVQTTTEHGEIYKWFTNWQQDILDNFVKQTANFNQPVNSQVVPESDSTTELLAISVFGLGIFLKREGNKSE